MANCAAIAFISSRAACGGDSIAEPGDAEKVMATAALFAAILVEQRDVELGIGARSKGKFAWQNSDDRVGLAIERH